MCTAIKCGMFVGRNLDITDGYGEEIIITPRRYSISLRKEENISTHYAILGMGTVSRGYPLYYDAINEYGIYAAGLNYVGNAKYLPPKEDKTNLAPFELIPYILSRCRTVDEAEAELSRINLTDLPFSRELPSAQLHWIVSDKDRAITVEPDDIGLSIYNNHIGVLTNNPSFPYQLFNLNNYPFLKRSNPNNAFFKNPPFTAYSEGMGALGLPGDLSSQSRFVRAAFHKSAAKTLDDLTTIFHILSSVEMPDGSVKVGDVFERTEYTTAVNLRTMTYYYRQYSSAGISSVKLFSENLDTQSLIRYAILGLEPVSQN